MNKRYWINGALIVSLALNLLIAGIMIGRWSHRPPDHMPGGLAAQFDESQVANLRQTLESRRESRRQFGREAGQFHERFRELLDQQPLPEEEVRATLAELRGRTGDFQAAMHEDMIRILKELNPEQRHRAARFLMNPIHSKPRPPG